MLTVALLGPIEVRRDGVLLPVPSGKTTEVLIRLALEAGAQVRTDRLIEDLWSDQPYGVARNTLQVKVSKLRRALGAPGLISGTGSGYTLHIEPACVDALDVQHRPPADALAMFRGEVLPGAGDWAEPYRTRLADLRLRLTEDDLADRGAESIDELEALVAEHPLRERPWHLLITALSRAGRPADALAAYDRARCVLADELGLDPSPELQDLQRRILQPPRPGNIPALSASLIGRDADVAALTGQTGRLVTVAGPAGVGKTRLAIEVARQAPAAWLVRLDGATSVWPGIGEAFGMGPSSEVMVLDRLRGLDALLVLDNCEHLVADLPDVIGRIIDAAPAVRILATSQVPLGIDGESVYELEPLSIADSMVLFTDRASRQRRSFRAETADVAEVCRALDGLPLAIELAAARAKALSVPEIARRLDDRFALLQDPSGRRPARQRTLRSAIGWSYGLLFPDDQRGLWALACFTGGAPLAAAEQVLAALGVPEASAMDVIERLVDRSLAAVDVDPGGAVRYRLLDSVRVFGLERLREAGQADVAAGAHAAWFAARAAEAEAGLRGPGQAVHLATVRTEWANIDAALSWCAVHDPPLGLRMANGFGWGWVFLGAGSDAARRSRAALAAAGPGAPAADRVDAMLFAGWFEASGGDLERAIAEVREAVRIADDKSRAWLILAFVHSQQGRPHEALADLAEFHGAGWERGAAWLLTAWSAIALGDVARGKQACSEALAVLTDDWALGHAEALLGALAQAEHRFADAVAHLTRATEAAGRLGFVAAGSLHRTNLGRAHQQNGDPAAAITAFERAIETAATAGDLRIVALARTRLARVLRALGRIDEARAQLRTARRWYATGGGGDGALLADHLAAAMDADEVALRQVLAAADPEITLLTLEALAYVAARDGRFAEAAALLNEADGLFPAVAHLVTDDDRIDRRRAVAMMA